ncbi:unnamed protein product [Acanthoscelides obtectus]|uniref:Uncharacterized protein n=1 Tax=Acanthoscelides obtectus TaxID=200917 RepID=A0A9P0NZ60_ACAOB|nr:unnamed protein product [Acanthoscelides obtectus]CAK1668039.1 hypothetical protein AOBTE_LOCUS26192 [Acanthoscelides obtectus]
MDLSSCASWLSCLTSDSDSSATAGAGERRAAVTEASDPQDGGITSVVTSGPGPSPASTNSCTDDVVPPPKNCYRLVVLGRSISISYRQRSGRRISLFWMYEVRHG